jgi:hypothetical protein
MSQLYLSLLLSKFPIIATSFNGKIILLFTVIHFRSTEESVSVSMSHFEITNSCQ